MSDIISEKAIAAGIAPREKFRTIYSGMELDWFLNAKFDSKRVRREFNIPGDAPVVGKIARLSAKGTDQLMDAAPEIGSPRPGWRFFIIGDGCCSNICRNAPPIWNFGEFVFAV